MARQAIPCGLHIDWPCCGCETEVLTGEDALERMQEEDDAEDADEHDDSMDGDFDSAMASAGHGMDEDYGCPDMMDIMYEDSISGGFDE
ncbi:MAG: hypothetical protein ACXAC5_02290 [Promethearchaeota archaeon]